MSFIEVYDNYNNLGISARKLTLGKEYNMVNDFIDYKKELFKPKSDKQLAIFLETKINNSYPDIVFAEYNPFKFENWAEERNNIEPFDFKILYYIYENKKIESQKIVKDLSITYKDLLSSLERLLSAKLIDVKNRNWYIRDKKIFGVRKIEAIEAKISKWDEVMQQALINKNFASESCVLSKINKPKQDIVNKLDSFGIGIYILSNNGFMQINKPQKRPYPMNYNSICFNEWIGRILNN